MSNGCDSSPTKADSHPAEIVGGGDAKAGDGSDNEKKMNGDSASGGDEQQQQQKRQHQAGISAIQVVSTDGGGDGVGEVTAEVYKPDQLTRFSVCFFENLSIIVFLFPSRA